MFHGSPCIIFLFPRLRVPWRCVKQSWIIASIKNELYQYYIGSKKKKRGILWIGRKEKQDTEDLELDSSEEVGSIPLAIVKERQAAISIQNEKEVQQTKNVCDSQDDKGEDMLEVMDRYRRYYMEETLDLPYSDEGNTTDLMMAMGTYLKQIDE